MFSEGLPLRYEPSGRLKREQKRHQLQSSEIRELEQRRRTLLRESEDPAVDQVRHLLAFRGIGMNSAWLEFDSVISARLWYRYT